MKKHTYLQRDINVFIYTKEKERDNLLMNLTLAMIVTIPMFVFGCLTLGLIAGLVI